MKRIGKIFMAALMAMLLTFTFASCSSGDIDNYNFENNDSYNIEPQISVEELILGKWELESQKNSSGNSTKFKLQTIKLYEDGTSSVNGEFGTWKIVGDELMILGDYGGRFFNSDSIVGKFSCIGDRLEFKNAQIDSKSNNINLVYKRVE